MIGVFGALVTFRAGITSEHTNHDKASDTRPDLCLPVADWEPLANTSALVQHLCACCLLRTLELHGILNSFVSTGDSTL